MTRKLFGTDGIRGHANTFPMTPEVALKVGLAAGRIFTHGDHRHRVVIGKDTRLSGYMIEIGADVGLHRRRHGRVPVRTAADARGRHADALAARRSRRDDLGLAQSLPRQRHQAVRSRWTRSCPTNARAEIEALMDNGLDERLAPAEQDRPRAPHRRRPGALHRIRQAHLPATSAARRSAHRRRLRQRRGLQGCARRAVGAGRGRLRASASNPTASTSTQKSARPPPMR